MENRIAYKLQEIEFRKVNPELLERNRLRIEAPIEAGENKKSERGVRLLPGTVLTRQYQWVEHRVTVTLDGRYDFEGRLYPGLAMIGREIIGTRWSGLVFFGLRKAGDFDRAPSRCRRASAAAPSTPGSPRTGDSTRSTTRSTPSATPVKPTS